MMAQRNEFDVGVIFSEDTDLIPALEAVAELHGPQSCESATWSPDDRSPHPLLLPHARLGRVHLFDRDHYDKVADLTDYMKKTRRR